MEQTEQLPQQSVGYYFLRSKEVHIENGAAFITFFIRLTRETSLRKEGKEKTRIQAVWVDLDEVKEGHATDRARALPNRMERYELTPNVFYSLYELTKTCPAELFYITPHYLNSTRKNFDT
ncbi:hypothetical protein [Metaplanococcus flavidus]|uniref:Uncharacterized protein n=1 Tax=Metaplanococcus flavidus TaxID=569883 RepID=A0ABW3L6F0_9BACL